MAAATSVTPSRTARQATGRISTRRATSRDGFRSRLGLPRDADVYLCGPTRFMADMKEALAGLRCGAGAHSHRDLQRRRVQDPWRRRRSRREPRICRRTRRKLARSYRSRAAAFPHTGTRRATRASWKWPRRVTFRSAGRAGPVFATTARAVWFRARPSTTRSRSTSPPTATFSSAAHSRPAML